MDISFWSSIFNVICINMKIICVKWRTQTWILNRFVNQCVKCKFKIPHHFVKLELPIAVSFLYSLINIGFRYSQVQKQPQGRLDWFGWWEQSWFIKIDFWNYIRYWFTIIGLGILIGKVLFRQNQMLSAKSCIEHYCWLLSYPCHETVIVISNIFEAFFLSSSSQSIIILNLDH